MKATLLDTQTGETIEIEDGINGEWVPRSWEWADNGWSCDCNRARYFGVNSTSQTCDGAHRFLVTQAQFDDEDYVYSLQELNENYPVDLLQKHNLLSIP